MKKKNDRQEPMKFPCLHLKRPGWPEIFYWPRLTIETAEGYVTPDVLLHARENGRELWAILEIDEDDQPTADSLLRERLVPLPTIRVGPDRILRWDFIEWLVSRIRALLSEASASKAC